MRAGALRLGAALAAALAAAGASAYVRTTSSQGACFYWQERSVPFRINDSRAASSLTCADTSQSPPDTAAILAVREGFRTWTGTVQGCTDLQLVDEGFTTSQNVGFDQRSGANENLVVFRKAWCSQAAPQGYDDPCWDVDPFATPNAIGETCANKYNCFEDPQPADRATIAVTTVTHDPRSGRIFDADIELADWNGEGRDTSLNPSRTNTAPDGWYFTCEPSAQTCNTYGQEGCDYVDLQSNVTHEVGHFIGLAHPCAIGDADCGERSPYRPLVMFPSASPGDTSKRTLTPDDQAGLCAIYPRGAGTSTCATRRKSSGGGCASGGGGGILSALLALAALARRRRP